MENEFDFREGDTVRVSIGETTFTEECTMISGSRGPGSVFAEFRPWWVHTGSIRLHSDEAEFEVV